MPALRDRREDTMLLANYFADKYGSRCNRKVKGFSPEARTCLMSYDWPGNVRELENAVERAVVLGTTDYILAEDLPEVLLELEGAAATPTTYHVAVAQTKKHLILNAINESGGSFMDAAKLLGVHPNYLQRLMRNLNLTTQVKK